MKKKYFTILFCMIALLLTGCAGTTGGRKADRDDIVGTWIYEKSDSLSTIQFLDDGTYVSDIVLNTGLSTHNVHRWDYTDDVLTVDYTDLGVKSKYSVKIKDDTMILDNGNATMTYVKK